MNFINYKISARYRSLINTLRARINSRHSTKNKINMINFFSTEKLSKASFEVIQLRTQWVKNLRAPSYLQADGTSHISRDPTRILQDITIDKDVLWSRSLLTIGWDNYMT